MARYLQRKQNMASLTQHEVPVSIRGKIFGFLSVSEVFCTCFCVSKSWRITRANWSTLIVHMSKNTDSKKIITIISNINFKSWEF